MLAAVSQLWAAQHALVVGIDDYLHLKPAAEARAAGDKISDLLGAENDAREISAALRSKGIALPQSRILLSRNATLTNFLIAWKDMTSQASAGDTLIVTFAGHGGQESEVSEPVDEQDGRDETIMFTDFNPANPREGRLNDDQLRNLLSDAEQFKIIWVMDSCHSGGLERSVNSNMTGLSRNGGNWDISIEPLEQEIHATTGDGDATLAHVTQILATASDERVVTETSFGGKPHGALSYFFAQGVKGGADQDRNGFVSRKELSNYLDTQVVSHMNQNQQPRLLPRGDSTVALSLGGETSLDTPKFSERSPVRVHVLGVNNPFIFNSNVQLVSHGADVTFEPVSGAWAVYNHTGDKITTLSSTQTDAAPKIIARAELMKVFPRLLRSDLPYGKVIANQSPELQKIGTRVGFHFIPPASDMRFLTIFNLAGDGTFQYLYPVNSDHPNIGEKGLPIEFKVTPPVGADQLVGIYCREQPHEFQSFLKTHDQGFAPEAAEFETYFQQVNCQIGRIGLFTSE